MGLAFTELRSNVVYNAIQANKACLQDACTARAARCRRLRPASAVPTLGATGCTSLYHATAMASTYIDCSGGCVGVEMKLSSRGGTQLNHETCAQLAEGRRRGGAAISRGETCISHCVPLLTCRSVPGGPRRPPKSNRGE